VVLGRDEERRRLPIADFILGPYATALEPGELVVAIDIPALPQGAGMAHLRFAFHERPAVTVSTLVRVTDGRIVEARVAVGSVGVRPTRAPEAESVLAGLDAAAPDPAIVAAAGKRAADASNPVTDANGSADYKHHLVGVLVGRAVRTAIDDASSQNSTAA
jgi:carbon-monoxide dehydrogenase medium subunit